MKKKSKYQYLEQCTNRISLLNAFDHLENFFLTSALFNRHLINKNVTIGISHVPQKDRIITFCLL